MNPRLVELLEKISEVIRLKCDFSVFWGGRALLAPVEVLGFTRKQWVLEGPGRQSFAFSEQLWSLRSIPQVLEDLGPL